ncbi:aminoglycoside adenylyltransferase domain-containing protein, partial [Candidatus Bipolaricaulota bacterium]
MEALVGERQYVAKHLSQYPDYCVLNLCRLIYSHRTGDVVVSKFGAAAWAIDAFPEWRGLIDL